MTRAALRLIERLQTPPAVLIAALDHWRPSRKSCYSAANALCPRGFGVRI